MTLDANARLLYVADQEVVAVVAIDLVTGERVFVAQ